MEVMPSLVQHLRSTNLQTRFNVVICIGNLVVDRKKEIISKRTRNEGQEKKRRRKNQGKEATEEVWKKERKKQAGRSGRRRN